MDWQNRYASLQYKRRGLIKEQKRGCWFCLHFGNSIPYPGCHTAAFRNGETCDLFIKDKDK